jgi:hypothetical protein
VFMTKTSCLIWALLLAFSLAFSSDRSAPARPVSALLPNQFGGWQAQGVQKSADPAVADSANALVLKEYGFHDFAGATYTRNGNEKLTIRAARFADASGAYGAFTFYRTRPMLEEKIGDRAGSLNKRILFYRGNVLVDAVFQELTAMSAAELRELASDLPLPAENAASLPSLPAYLPQQSNIANSAKYILGPEGLQIMGAPIPAQLVNFGSGAEVMLSNYQSSRGEAALMVISYPTPQIAAQALHQIDAQSSSFLAPIYDKRTGPLLVLVTGSVSQDEAKSLLASVNYEANVTWNENTYFSKKDNIGNLIVNVIILCAIIGGLAVVAGLAFGGFRILVKRLWPGRVFDRAEDVEFISLHLGEGSPKQVHRPNGRW